MDNKITIRDVAKETGLSISSVHLALSGKPGVSEQTRERVKQAARKLGYHPNVAASNLKRKTQRIAVLLPSEAGNNQYYYPQLWKGIHDCYREIGLNLDLTELPYDEGEDSRALSQLLRLLDSNEADGVLTVGHIDKGVVTEEAWKAVEDHGIPILYLNSLNRHEQYLCCVQPDYEVIGRTMAELVTTHIPEYGSILLCAGNPRWESHALVVKGFEDYMREKRCANLVYKDLSFSIGKDQYAGILHELSRPDIAACCSVSSQGTILMARALEESQKASRLYAVGSDLSDETAEWIRKGVLNNSIQKNPYSQGFVGMRILSDYLIRRRVPPEKIINVGSEVVFASNLSMYEKDRPYRLLL